MAKPVSLVGLGHSATHAPWKRRGWDMWTMATNPYAPFSDIVFEIHDSSEWFPYELSANRLNEFGTKIMVQVHVPGLKRELIYPIDEVVAIGGDYFGSTLAFQIGLAVLQKRPKIAIFGFDMGGQDGYAHQRFNAEYWIGIARGRGIEVEVAEGSCLLKLWEAGGDEVGEQNARHLYGLNGRYGVLKGKEDGSNSSNR